MSERNPDRARYQQTLLELLGSRPVAYWPSLAKRVGGVKAAVMLSQLLYWNGDKRVQARDGWFYKSIDDLTEETGLTKIEQQTARQTLQKLKLVDCKLTGVPRIWHYRINFDALTDLFIGRESHPMDQPSNENPAQYSAGNRSNNGRFTGRSLGGNPTQLNKVLETTSETTSEITNKTSSSSYPLLETDTYPYITDLTEEEEVGFKQLKGLLQEIGVFEESLPEVVNTILAKNLTLTDIEKMIAAANRTDPAGAANIFIYRLRKRIARGG